MAAKKRVSRRYKVYIQYIEGDWTNPGFLLLTLKNRRATDTLSQPIFMNPNGSPMHSKQWEKLTDRISAATNVKFTPHCFRVGGATDLIEKGFTTFELKLMGKWDCGIAEIYPKITANVVKMAAMMSFSQQSCSLPQLVRDAEPSVSLQIVDAEMCDSDSSV